VEFDALGYLCTQYFGRTIVGRTYGIMYMLFNIGSGIGVYFGGLSYDAFSSYDIALWAGASIIFVAIVIITTMGPYPELPKIEISTEN